MDLGLPPKQPTRQRPSCSSLHIISLSPRCTLKESPDSPVFPFTTSTYELDSFSKALTLLSTLPTDESHWKLFLTTGKETPRALNFLANRNQPPTKPFPSGKTRQNFFPSTSLTEQSKNLLATLERHSSLNFLPSSSQTFKRLKFDSPLHQASTPSNRRLQLFSPNLIQEEKPLLLSKIVPLNLPRTTSMEISNALDSTANQHLPPFKTPLESIPSRRFKLCINSA